MTRSQMSSSEELKANVLFLPDKIDTKAGLWLVDNVLDVDLIPCNGAMLGYQDAECVKAAKEFLTSFPCVFLAYADKVRRNDVAELISDFVPEARIYLPRDDAFGDNVTVSEVFHTGGAEAVDKLLIGAKEKPAQGLIDIADVEKPNWENRKAIMSGIEDIDREIGGFATSQLTIWTGKRGSGKSTLLSQLLVEAINQGYRTFAYSGELPDWMFKQWLTQQAAGRGFTYEKHIEGDKVVYDVTPEVQKRIDDWWRGKLFLSDNKKNSANDEETILSLAELAYIRHGCEVFLFDNLMTVRFNGQNDNDFYRSQSNFVGRLVEFTKKNNVSCHLVAHPRKTDGKRMLEADDVGGSGDITNKADNVISITRLSEEERLGRGFEAVASIVKNREFGSTISVGLNFDEASRRFYKVGTTPYKQYGWKGKQ